MMVMTAKVNPKKILCCVLAAALLVGAAVWCMGGKKASATAAPAVSANDGRVQFLKDFGWQVNNSPKESGAVRVPERTSKLFERYNALQLTQGYDLSDFSGKKVMRYVYEVTNYPGGTEPVYATLLIYKNKVIGGDITDTAVKGKIHGFKMPVLTETAPARIEPTVDAPTETPEDTLG